MLLKLVMTGDNLDQIRISIAGIGMSIHSGSQWLLQVMASRYSEYLTSTAPDFITYIDWQKTIRTSLPAIPTLKFNNDLLKFNAPGYEGYIDGEKNSAKLIVSTDNPIIEVDYFLALVIAYLIYTKGGFLFHGAGIIRKQLAYIFFGKSGSGKTTVSRLSANDIILNDDLIAIIPEECGWMVYGTPFTNPKQVNGRNLQAPLDSMYRLIQDSRVYLDQMSDAQSIAEVISCVPVISTYSTYASNLADRCLNLITTVPVYRLHFLPDASFWRVIMERGGKK